MIRPASEKFLPALDNLGFNTGHVKLRIEAFPKSPLSLRERVRVRAELMVIVVL
jgi:hypothetical protein